MAIAYRTDRYRIHRVAEELQAMGTQVMAVATDVTRPERVKELVQEVVRRFGRVDILVNNVGEFIWKTVMDSTPDEWHAMLASNLDSVFYTSKEVLLVMRAQRGGRIINLGSAGAERAFGQATISAYAAAKAGVVAFSRSLALEEARYGITVNVVNPAILDNKDLTLEEAKRISDTRFPVGRPATAQDVAEAVKFFAQDESGFITGQALTVSGGWML